jgi:hypothetical protein
MSIATSLQTRVEMVKQAFLMSYHTKSSCGLCVMLLEASVPECMGLLLERFRFSEQYECLRHASIICGNVVTSVASVNTW